VNWTGPCFTNNFSTQRQDVTGLELSNMGGGNTRIIAAIGTRGFATTVQYDLGNNGANGLYSATMGLSGCPSFTSIASNANGFVFGNFVSGSAYSTGANMNAGSGSPFVDINTGDQLGRIDIAVAPSNANYIYAQGQSIVGNSNGGCGSAPGCQIGAWASTDGGASWSYMEGSQGGALGDCGFDYPQNWYDQGVAVDPNNPDRVFFDTYDVWFATRTGTVWNDTTCGYSGANPRPVHVDQHALAFVPGSSSILLIGNDGGAHGTTNADIVNQTTDPTWFNMDTITALSPSHLPEHQPDRCYGSWERVATDSMDALIPLARERVCAFGRATITARCIAASVTARLRMLLGAVMYRAAPASGATTQDRSFSRTIFSMVAFQGAMIVRQRVCQAVAAI